MITRSLSKRVDTLTEPISDLLKQTIECCNFLREYVSHDFASECTLVFLYSWKPVDWFVIFLEQLFDFSSSKKIDEFEKSFASLGRNIHAGATIRTAVVLLRMSGRIDDVYV